MYVKRANTVPFHRPCKGDNQCTHGLWVCLRILQSYSASTDPILIKSAAFGLAQCAFMIKKLDSGEFPMAILRAVEAGLETDLSVEPKLTSLILPHPMDFIEFALTFDLGELVAFTF